MAITYNNLYMDIRQELRQAGIQAATLEARELVCFATGKTREELLRDGRLYLTPEVEKQVWDLVQRHLDGEPVAYLIGEWEFYGLPLDINEHVLIPRVDTEVLAREAIDFVKEQGKCRVLDLCAGSGCVGLAIAAQARQTRVVLGELSEGALRICRQNIRRNGLSGQVVPLMMDVMEGPSPQLGEFDCIVSNPPYIPTSTLPSLSPEVRCEPEAALDGGEDGLTFYRALLFDYAKYLKVDGFFLLEIGYDQAEAVRLLARESGFPVCRLLRDYGGQDRVLLLRRTEK